MPDPFKSTTTEPKLQADDGKYASALVKKMEAGTKSFLAKWGGQKEKHADHTQTSWDEPVQPESRGDPVQTPASSVASTMDEEETRIVYTPAELMTVQSQAAKVTPMVDPVPIPVHESLKPEEVSKQQPSAVTETLPTESDVSFLPPHLRISPASSSNAQKPKLASSGDVTKEKPSVFQPPPALPTMSTSKTTIPPIKDQNLKHSNLEASALKPSSVGIRQVSTSSASYRARANAVAAAAKAMGDRELFFKSYPKPESRRPGELTLLLSTTAMTFLSWN